MKFLQININPAKALIKHRWDNTPKDKQCRVCGNPARMYYCSNRCRNKVAKAKYKEKIKSKVNKNSAKSH